MSICIKGMKKPRSCDFCPISLPHAEELGCGFDLEHCLITEVPPHGRLIDMDGEIVVKTTIKRGKNCNVELYAPVIIQATDVATKYSTLAENVTG